MATHEQSTWQIIMRKTKFRLKHITTVAPHTVRVTYTDNSVVTVDLAPLIESLAVFAPLESAKEFASASITDFGFTLEWSCGASLDLDRLFEMSLEQAGMVSNAVFRRWQDTHHLSLTQEVGKLNKSTPEKKSLKIIRAVLVSA